jgi:hypothetical protein
MQMAPKGLQSRSVLSLADSGAPLNLRFETRNVNFSRFRHPVLRHCSRVRDKVEQRKTLRTPHESAEGFS